MRRGVALVALLAAVAVGGCGSEEGDADEPQPGDQPVATESLEEFTQVFEDAQESVADGDCTPFTDLFKAWQGGLSCKELQQLAVDDPMTVEGTEDFGPVAVLETTAETEGASTWALGAEYDGKWRILNQFVAAKDDQPLEAAETDAVAESYIEAIRAADCDAFIETITLGAASPDEACASIEQGPLADAVKATEGEVEALGGDEFIRFYGISLGEEGWFNFGTLDQSGDPKVMFNQWVTHPDSPSAPEATAGETEEK